jgi:pSer/pThr/pTyr-binding forkhead associated (FHA) protein
VPQKPTLQQNPVVQSAGAQVRGMTDGAPARAQARSAAEKPAETAEGAGVRTSKSKQGRLFGWLVSYENPDGRAIELRAGRFFVTGTSIRPTDLILEDQSISTPHALMAITESGLQLQDLMSERGTFVRCQGEAQYVRQDGVIEVQHGDWIRFGDVEFLVTVVPS